MAAPGEKAASAVGYGGGRAPIAARTLRTDRWWAPLVITFVVLSGFVAYATWPAFAHADYYWRPYISPFYSPCLATTCLHARAGSAHGVPVPSVGIVGPWWIISPATIILIVPLGFRLTCYYYRKAYYRAFWLAPPSCAVGEPHRRYSGETRFPLILQNVHRYFFYLGFVLNAILTYDAVVAFRDDAGHWGHMGFGTVVLVANASLLWLYTLGCHSCRHVIAGRLKHFSRHPIRYRMWVVVTKLNERHMQFAWASLIFVAVTDLYVRLVSSGTMSDPRFF